MGFFLGHGSFRFFEMEVKHLIVLLALINGVFGKCIWYGQCKMTSTGKIENIHNVIDPKPFDITEREEAMKIMREKCRFFLEKYPEGKYCCDLKMVKTMAAGLKLAEMIFNRCPTCINNWFQHVCEFNCSPDQHLFMNPKEIRTDEDGNKCVHNIDIYLTDRYKESAFNSCKDVAMPSSGLRAMVHACRNDKHCTPKKWFESMGDVTQTQVPFQINYIKPPSDSFTALDLPTRPCNESFDSGFPCSCADCEASCMIPFEDPTNKDTCPLVMEDLTYITLCLIGILICSTIFFFSWAWIYRGSGESTLLERVGDSVHLSLENFFTSWGLKCALHPVKISVAVCILAFALIWGANYLRLTVEPVEIWASPNSECRKDKEYFDSRFGPFYRTSQIFLKTKNLPPIQWKHPDTEKVIQLGPIFQKEFLESVYNLQMKIQNIVTENGHQLKDICFAPMRSDGAKDTNVEECTVQSVWGYLGNNIELLEDEDEYRQKLFDCLSDNFQWDCLAPYRGPIFSELAVVGFKESKLIVDGIEYFDALYETATGIILTFLINNHADKGKLGPALEWEERFIALVKTWAKYEKPDFIEVAFSAERSIEDEIERESNAEIGTMVFSYVIMFLYITISLGKFRRISSLLVESKIMLGIAGIIIVISSVLSSLGFFGYLGIPTTLLTIEVIPFLILAVGVDNIFILVHTVQDMKGTDPPHELIGRALGAVGPSILLTTLSEALCFLIGSLSGMPAVKTFALYSSVAIILNFFLQITIFISYLSLDLRRVQARRLDVFCCFKASKKSKRDDGADSEFLRAFFRKCYGPFLMKRRVRICVIVVFVGWFIVSAFLTTRIELGLDQELTVPEDSYLVDYFTNLRDLLSMGPPVYFVVKKGLDFNNPLHVNSVCGTVGCKQTSLITYLTRASALENMTYIVKSPSSWIDDYFAWIAAPSCCKMFENGTYCPEKLRDECVKCTVTLDEDSRPTPEDFRNYLSFFLADNPNDECTKAGKAAYSGAITFEDNGVDVADSYFMAYHTVLRTSKDYYTALERSKNIAKHLSKALSEEVNFQVEVFPYSVFYVFYEQYLTIVNDAIVSLCLSLFTVFGVTFILTGFDYVSSLLVLITISSIIVDMMGLMYVWGITLNAISLVNLIVAVGIGVEFCSHLVHSFATSVENDKISRALNSISTIGHSLFSGITVTKFSGIVVLAFARSLIFRIFYFRMYLLMVLIGAAHGLMLLPVLLSYFGPRINSHRAKRLRSSSFYNGNGP
ncbi:UNVERIFIED_CONTAM: hypothetical protein PYX00_001253 [Menopon gallinae]|uniref:SSD domain-containing protein n=1 Tax=Menopon gallinae TaxID=328185 RepID=A0AAW2ICV7_9NEOP